MATYGGLGIDESFKAAVDLSASQYQFVKAGSIAGEVTLCGTLGASVLGVLQNDPKAGEEAVVRIFGLTKLQANTYTTASPLTYGGRIKCASDGRAHGSLALAACTWESGIALEAVSSGSGQIITAFVFPSMRPAG